MFLFIYCVLIFHLVLNPLYCDDVMLFPLPITILVIFQYWANKTCSNRKRKQYTSFPVKVDTVLKSEAR